MYNISLTKTLFGLFYINFTVALNPKITLAKQILATAVRVEWSQPSRGATVTGYVVHYSDGDTDRNESVAANSTSHDTTDLTSGLTYTISVEATSEHLSGVSDEMDITLGMLLHRDFSLILHNNRHTLYMHVYTQRVVQTMCSSLKPSFIEQCTRHFCE